jgi:HK97 gp10 family phage protein
VDVDNRPIPRDVLVALSQTPEVTAQTRRLANDIAKDARQLAPVRTGNLKTRGIGVERMVDRATGAVFYAVGWTPEGWYGWLVERGTEDTTPRPHLVPAAVKHGARSAAG